MEIIGAGHTDVKVELTWVQDRGSSHKSYEDFHPTRQN